jgi:hypothetical protein
MPLVEVALGATLVFQLLRAKRRAAKRRAFLYEMLGELPDFDLDVIMAIATMVALSREQ